MRRYGRNRADSCKVAPAVAITAVSSLCAVSCEFAAFNPTIEDVVAIEVIITADFDSVGVGESAQLEAEVLDASGKVLSERQVVWQSSDETVLVVDAGGTITGVKPGPASVTATSGGVSKTKNIGVSPNRVRAVQVTPVRADLQPRATAQLTAVPLDANGYPLARRSIKWRSTRESVATVNRSGLVTAVAFGEASVTARSGAKAGSSLITVRQTAEPVASVSVTPASATIEVGSSIQLTAVALGAQGDTLVGRAISWSSMNPAVASVSNSGLVSGHAAGVAVIQASSEGKTGQSSVTVITRPPPPVHRVNVIPSTASVAIGGNIQLTATPLDSAGNPLMDRTVAWTSSNPQTATVDQSGFVSALSEGEVTITATSEGVSGTATVTVLSQTGVLFRSDWTYALGNSENALADGGKWDQTYLGNPGILEVVNGAGVGAPTGNALRVKQTGCASYDDYGAVEVNDFSPIGQDFYLRFYLRVDDTGGAVNHYGTCDVMGYQRLTYHAHTSYAGGWALNMIMNYQKSYPLENWILLDPNSAGNWPANSIRLSYGTWYRLEYWVEWVEPGKFRVYPRIYSHPGGELLYDYGDFGNEQWGMAGGYPGGKYGDKWTLKAYYEEGASELGSPHGYMYGDVPTNLNDLGLGNNCATASSNSGEYWYYAGVEIRSDTWPGGVP